MAADSRHIGWSGASPCAFGAVATLHTSAGGAGAVEFERTGPLLQFDLLVQVVGNDGTVLQSNCMKITAK
jgi:hypothetical protein